MHFKRRLRADRPRPIRGGRSSSATTAPTSQGHCASLQLNVPADVTARR